MTPVTPTAETTGPAAPESANAPDTTAANSVLRDLARLRPSMVRDYGIVLILILLFVVLSISSGRF